MDRVSIGALILWRRYWEPFLIAQIGRELESNTESGYCNGAIFKYNVYPIPDGSTITGASIAFNIGTTNNDVIPQRTCDWKWFDFDELPSLLFLPLSNLFKAGSLETLASRYLPHEGKSEKVNLQEKFAQEYPNS